MEAHPKGPRPTEPDWERAPSEPPGALRRVPPVRTLGFGQVLALAFSPDELLAVGCRGGSSVQLVDTQTWRVIRTLEGHSQAVTGVAFGRDGRWLVSGSEDGSVRVWEVETGEERWRAQGPDKVWSVGFSPSGSLVVSGGAGVPGRVEVRHASSGDLAGALRGHLWSVSSVALSPDGRLLASGSWDQRVCLWALPGGEAVRVLDGHVDHVLAVAFSPRGDLLASCSVDKTVRLWDVGSGKLVRVLRGHAGPVLSVAFSSDGTELASGATDHTARVWNVSTGRAKGVLPDHGGWVNAVAFSPSGDCLVTGCEDQLLRIWSWPSGRLLGTVLPRANWVDRVEFGPEDGTLTARTREGAVFQWEVGSGRLLGVSPEPPEAGAAGATPREVSPDGRWEAEAAADGRFHLRNRGCPGRAQVLKADQWRVTGVAFRGDSRVLASGSEDGAIRLWSVPAGTLLVELRGHTDWVSGLAFSSDGTVLASGSRDGTVKLWDVSSVQAG